MKVHKNSVVVPALTTIATGIMNGCQNNIEFADLNKTETVVTKRNPKLGKIARLVTDSAGWRSMTKLNTQTLDQQSAQEPIIPKNNDHDVCTLEESPYYIYRVCAQGQVDILLKLLEEDENKAHDKDNKGWTCLHHAASRGRIKVIDILLHHNADIDAVDKEGRTPLHLACEKGKLDAIGHVIMCGARTDILCNTGEVAPIHIATITNQPKVIQALLEFPDKVDVDLPGAHGGTALHKAAMMNLAECAQVLLNHGAKVCTPCSNGLYPIHVAAKNASMECLEVLLKAGEARGYRRDHMLSYVDKEKNSPLHSAVNSGDIKTVQICIEHGARIDARQEDQATAFHLACSQGTLCIVRIMLEAHLKENPETGVEILFARDVLDMTPLHRAAMFDHPEVVEYLINMGSEVDCLDSVRRTPLLLSAVRGCTSVFKKLLEKKARLTVKDDCKRNVLHYIATFRGNLLEQLNMICSTDDGLKLLNQQDGCGCTPLHLASKEGNLHYLERLIKYGATLNIKNNEEQSPLHFAARYGRVHTVRKLLNSVYGAMIINETDGSGMTAMHIASHNGHTKVVHTLLKKGALLHKDYSGSTPLHYAAERGYSQTSKLLLSYHMNLLNQIDKNGVKNTAMHKACAHNQSSVCELLLSADCVYEKNLDDYYPLDIAMECRHVEVALVMIKHERYETVLNTTSKLFKCPLLGLIQVIPEVYLALLNRCHTVAQKDPAAIDYWEKYDFRFMETDPKKLRQIKKMDANSVLKPLMAMNTMVKSGRIELLSHPVSTTYLNMKWRAYGAWVFCINLILYLLFLGCLTGVIISLNPEAGPVQPDPDAAIEKTINATTEPTKTRMNTGCFMASVFVFIFLILNILKEFMQMWQQRLAYFADMINYIEWTLFISSLIFVVPIPFSNGISPVQWRCGAIAIFLAWFNLLLYLRRLDSVGIFVVMFLQILDTVLRVMLVFSVLFVAFGLTFYILLANDNKNGYKDPILSTVHSVMMMMGDWDFVDTFVNPGSTEGNLMHPVLSFIMLIVFVILMPILFINLLIGLAVGDIEMVQNHAQLQRLAMQVEYHTELEEKLPSWLLFKVDKPELVIWPNKGCWGGKLGQMINTVMKTMNSALYTANDKGKGGTGGAGRSKVGSAEYMQDSVHQEVMAMKRKMKETQAQLEKQYDLLRLIVEKMEIVSEASQYDEGVSNARQHDCYSEEMKSPRSKVWTEAAVVSKWKTTK